MAIHKQRIWKIFYGFLGLIIALISNIGRKEQTIRFVLGGALGTTAWFAPLGEAGRWGLLALAVLIVVEGIFRY